MTREKLERLHSLHTDIGQLKNYIYAVNDIEEKKETMLFIAMLEQQAAVLHRDIEAYISGFDSADMRMRLSLRYINALPEEQIAASIVNHD